MKRTILLVGIALVNGACTSTQSLRDKPGATRAQVCHNAAIGQLSGGDLREDAIALAVDRGYIHASNVPEIRKNIVFVGMTTCEVQAAWGPPDEWHDHTSSKGRQVSYWYKNGRRWVSFDAEGRARSISSQ
jgi:hypothetical protein